MKTVDIHVQADCPESFFDRPGATLIVSDQLVGRSDGTFTFTSAEKIALEMRAKYPHTKILLVNGEKMRELTKEGKIRDYP